MKKNKYILFIFTFIMLFLALPVKTYAVTESEARTMIAKYAQFVLDKKKDTITYSYPKEVMFKEVSRGYYTVGSNFGVDCNAFVSFVIYNALQANSTNDVFDSDFSRVAGTGINGWSSHSKYYNSKMYPLNENETIQDAANRIELKSLLESGDLIGVVGYEHNGTEIEKFSHIMLYVGDGNYIHNRSSGVAKNNISNISFATKKGLKFEGDIHGSITVLKLKNFDSIPSSCIEKFRYPDGNGKYEFYNLDGTKIGGITPTSPTSSGDYCTEVIEDEVGSRTSEGGGGYSSHSTIDPIDTDYEFGKIIYIIGIILFIVRIIVPVILIVMSSLDLVKAMTQKDDREMREVVLGILPKVLSAIVVFLLPSIIALIMTLAKKDEEWNVYSKCLISPFSCEIDIWSNNSLSNTLGEVKNTENDFAVSLTKCGVYIKISSNEDVSAYYFSHKDISLTGSEADWIKSSKERIDFALLPGNYYIYIKFKSGEIVKKHVEISIDDIVDTKRKTDIKELKKPFEDFLKEKGTSITDINNMIYRSVEIASFGYSGEEAERRKVAIVGLALTQSLYNRWKIKIPYNFNNYSKYGVNPKWGQDSKIYEGKSDYSEKQKKYQHYNAGIHCGGFVAWDFSNANYDMNSGIGSSEQLCSWGYGKKVNTNDGIQGDVVTTSTDCKISSHVGIITYVTSSGIWVTESDNPGITTTFDKYSGIRWRSAINMTSTYNSKKKSSASKSGF